MSAAVHEAAALAFMGSAFRAARERAGLSVRGAAGEAGVSPRVVSHAENGKPVSSTSFLRLCRLHEVNPFALLDAAELHRREGAFHKAGGRGVSRGTTSVTRCNSTTREARP
ncbi:helix-turn-helix domain-containing protein [Stappia sp. ICDLI1TA098]